LLALLPDGARAQVILGFEDLPSPPALDASLDLGSANGGSFTYGGVVWDSRTQIGGKNVKISTDPGTPFFGIPHAGDYYFWHDVADGGQAVTMTTTMVLTGAWFGQNEYYGFGGGASEVTVHAMNGGTILGSVTLTLPDNNPGLPEPLSFMDTSSFLALSGITGYRIDHLPIDPFDNNFIADDFSFVAAPVPEPGPIAVAAGIALGGWVGFRRLRRR
jgi:hypothetical protein